MTHISLERTWLGIRHRITGPAQGGLVEPRGILSPAQGGVKGQQECQDGDLRDPLEGWRGGDWDPVGWSTWFCRDTTDPETGS